MKSKEDAALKSVRVTIAEDHTVLKSVDGRPRRAEIGFCQGIFFLEW